MTSPVEIRRASTLPELDALADAWARLPGSCCSPLLTHDWFCAAATTLHPDRRLAVITAWREGQLVGVAPLVEVRRGAARWLEFIGSEPLYEPCDFLYQDPAVIEDLVRHLLDLRLPMALQRVPADGPVVRSLNAQRRGWLFRVPGAPCSRVDTHGTWNDYLRGRSAECRAGYPQRRRILESLGVVRFESVSPDRPQSDTLLDELMRVESTGWKLANGSALVLRPHLQSFFREVSRRFAARGQLRVNLLRCDQQTVAIQWLLEFGGRLWELKIAYDERWRRASPGRLLLWESLRMAFQRGFDAHEFLGAGDGQQPTWATGALPLETLVWYPNSAAGFMAAATDILRRIRRYARGST
jgi:CelD/BcsL family acetyltransferase involved in cellulose biosynthesis